MTPKNNVVRLRLTETEHKFWSEAAGGKGKLSSWIRQTCNIAAVGSHEPVAAEQAALETLSPGTVVAVDHTETVEETVVKKAQEQCPRWMHHRPNTYCGSCKRVQK